ncbi:protein CANDIDATE G-PROTEIN COUPLED RECEPTOR 7 [Fagus crenata]
MVVIQLQILENIAYVVLEETSLASTAWLTTWHIIFLVDMMCCGAVFLPIFWSISSLEEASKTKGKAARTLEKLTFFRRFYMVIVTYMYFTRCIVLVVGMGDYQFEWVTNASAEGANLAFYVFLFYNFKPIKRNPYLVIDEEEENDASQLLETHRW